MLEDAHTIPMSRSLLNLALAATYVSGERHGSRDERWVGLRVKGSLGDVGIERKLKCT